VQIDRDQALVTTATGRLHVSQKDRTNAISNCPMQLMLGALGACIMLTVNAVAKHKGIAIDDSFVCMEYFKEKSGGIRFQVDLKLNDRLTSRERKILYHSARACEVGKIIKGDVRIDYDLLDHASD
jgi:uncharacterized OsmC-like protein